MLAGSINAGYADGSGDKAKFYNPYGVVYNSTDKCCYVADYSSHVIRKVSPSGTWFFFDLILIFYSGEVTTFCGSQKPGWQDGQPSTAQFYYPVGITYLRETGELFVASYQNNRICKVSPNGKTRH